MLNNFFKLFTVVFLLVTFAFSSNAFAQLVGGTTYPINGTEAPPTSFGSITTAASYLATNGVTGTGQVYLELNTGYAGEPGPVTIGVITGTSASLGVTFRPALGYTALTSVVGGASPNQHAIKLTGNYVTLDGRAGGVGSSRDWTISCTGTNGQMAVRLDNTTNSMTGIVVRNLIMEGAATNTTGGIFQITGSSTNTISSITIEQNLLQSGATFRGYGMTLASASNVGNTGIIVRNNVIRQFYARGINLTGGFPGIEIYGNEIYHSAAVTQPSTSEFAAFYFSTTASTGAKIYNNYIHDIQLTNGTTSAMGMYFFNGNTSGAPIEIFNNRIQIGNGITPTTFPIYGIRDNAVSGALFNIYFNSVLVDGIASAGTSNSAAFIKGASNFINLKNNIFYNARSNSAGTGTHWGISINNTTFASINNNDYFADGTGGVLGTTTGLVAGNQTTLAGWKGVVTADGSSVSQIPNYVAGLKINTSIATQLESGGATGTGVANDFEGETRLSPPDIGADEFLGTGLDITPPAMAFTLLSNTSYLANRQLTVAITDPSNIATSPNGPALYYKKKNDVSFIVDNTPTVAGSNYTFTINSASLGVAAGDTIQYYVAAMDLIGNSGTSPAGGSGTPPGSTPPATFNSYAIVTALALPYSQDFNAGTTLPTGWGGTMFVTANHGTAGSNGLNRNLYSSTTTANANTPIVGPIAATTQLEFDYRIVDFSSYPATATTIGAGDVYNVRISTDDGATYTTVYTINQANHVVSTNFATVVVPLGAYAGFNGVIRWELQWGAGDYYFDIDNVIVRVPPVGPPNTAALVSPANGGTSISINTTLNWASGGGAVETGYRIYFGTDGGGVTPPTNIANNVDLGLVTAYTPASPLAYSTTYYWQIVPYNGSGNATGNVIWSFTTGPNPAISTFPYAEGFEGTSFPPYGYSTYGTKLWVSGTEAHTGLKSAKISYTPAGTGSLQTPSVIIPATPNYRIKFWWKDDDITDRPSGDGIEIALHDTTYFEISTDGGTSWTVLSFLAAASAQTSYSEVIQNLTSYAGQTVLFRWRDVSDGTLSAYGTGLDDIAIEQIPSVLDPTPFTATTINSSQINLAFTPDPATHNVLIVWNNTGTFTVPTDPPPAVGQPFAGGTVLSYGTTSPVNHTGLTFATTYYYIAFSYDGATYSTPGATANAITNVVNPTAVTATPIDASQINLGWTKNANNDNVMVVTNSVNTFGVPVNGTAYAVNDPVTGGGTVVFNGSAAAFNHTSLTAGTTYYYKLFSAEAVTNNYSSGVTANATTPFALPYFQNFNAATTIPAGWSTNFFVSATHGAGGTNGLARNLYDTAPTGVARTPFVGLAAANTTFEFDYRIVDWSSYPSTATVYGPGNYVQVQVSTDNTTWTTVYTIDNTTHITSLAFANKQINLAAYNGSYIYVRFNCQWASGDYYLDFDNVYLGPPSVANPGTFTASTISTTQIDLAFTTNPSTNNVVIVWNNTGTFTIPSGTPPAAGQPFAGGTLLSNGIVSPVNHTGLTASTAYYYKAFSYNGTDYSTGLDANATTTCGVASLPFNESFDGTLFPPTCWTRINAGTGNNWLRSTAAPYAGAGNMRYTYSGTSAANTWMITPEFTLTSGKKYYVSFYQNTSGSYPEKLKVTVGSAPDVVSQTTVIWDNAGGTSLTNSTYELRIAEFVAPSTGSYYFGFNCYSDADQWYLDVDEISIIEQPTVDLAFTQFSQTSGLPVPKAGQTFSDYSVSLNKKTLIDGKKHLMELTNQSNAVSSSNVNNTVIVPENGSLNLDALGNIGVSAQISNLGVNAASYNLNWSVNSIAQTPYSGPTVNSGSNHVANLTFASTDRGTFITTGAITVAGDEIASNNANQFRMRVYPDVFTRTIYDRGDNLVDTYIGWGPTGTTPFKAGVRFTAASEIKLAGVDFIYRTEDLVPGQITVQVRAAGTTTTAPGAVLYTAVFNTAAYFSSTGDYIHLPFGNDAPIIASGSDYWITVKVPLGADYPGAAQTGAGITLGRSFYESNTDTTLWNALILTPDEFAWIMRSVEVTAGPATFAFSKSVNNGWNMVSVPGLHPTNQNVTTWWSGKDPAAGVFRFSGGYVPVTTTTPGQGYWMKHIGPFTYNYTGIQVVANTPIAGVTGWNLIGGYELSVATSGITTSPAGLQTGSVFQYGTGYTVATTLVPGTGYWIKLTGAGSINIPTSLAKGLAKNEVNTSDWGKIIITDKSGNSYTLYTVKGEVNLNDYELPPAPPEGMFDVRFGSGRYAEELSTVNQTIELNSLEYPVRVRVENADIRLQDGTGNGLNERLKSGEEVTISNSAINKLMVSGDVIPATYSLDQNYPNPFNPSTKIEFSIPEDVNNVTLTIYNALGQRVAELVNSKMEAGKYSYVWNASDVATGLYIYELRTDKFVSVKKMMLLK